MAHRESSSHCTPLIDRIAAGVNSLGCVQDSDFIQQMVKAASVAFGGGRPNDYPKARGI